MTHIFDKNIIEEQLHLMHRWEQEAFQAFVHNMTDKMHPFPCIPATIGFIQNHLRYAFLDELSKNKSAQKLAAVLKTYGSTAKEMGNYTSLIVFFKPSSPQTRTLIEAEQLFWQLLSKVNELDDKPWPEYVPQNPHDPSWEFCFNGEQYFIYCGTPNHKSRKSRSFPFFMLAFTPRWILQHFKGSHPNANQMKKHIRERLVVYDEVPPHPELKWYGQEDNFEWRQYFLRDDQTSLSSCPFAKLREQKNSQ